jgi:uncharacterized delta-60 repeat protein
MLIPAACAQNVTIDLIPITYPIVLPDSGGSFDYTIAATNTSGIEQGFQVWCTITLPNGNPYGPVFGPVTIVLQPGQTLRRLRTQNIPAGAPEGNYTFNAFAGFCPNPIWDSHFFTFAKLGDLGGIALWEARYNGPSNETDDARCIALDREGDVIVTGYSEGESSSFDFATIKYNSAGMRLWIARYATSSYDEATSLALDGDGNAYVAGFTEGYAGGRNYVTIKYNSAGAEQWVALYNGPDRSADEAYDLAVDQVGNVYVTGRSHVSENDWDYATVKYDSAGQQQWCARYNGPGNEFDEAYAVAVDNGGNVYVTGLSHGNGTYSDYATIKYNSQGEQQWVARYDGPLNYGDWAHDVVLDLAGNVYVTGHSWGTSFNTDYATIKYNSAGEQQWVARYNGPINGYDYARALALDGDGNVLVTGESMGDRDLYEYATIKYNSAGIEQWVARYSGPGDGWEGGTSIAADVSGNVFVTGSSIGIGTDYDYATLKYNAFGQQIWVARYTGPGNDWDYAYSLVLDGGGNAYVTGSSAGCGTGTDYCTIKYSGVEIASWIPMEATVFGQPMPQECRLEPNYPNPFNPATTIRFTLPLATQVNLSIYDISGRLVTSLVDGFREAGIHEATFNASRLPSGIYLARIEAAGFEAVRKLLLVK